jgi:hypothetical protein
MNTTQLNKLNCKRLKQICKENKLKKYSKLRKKELINLLVNYYKQNKLNNNKQQTNNKIKNILIEYVKESGIVDMIMKYKQSFELYDYKKNILNKEINNIKKFYNIDYKRVKLNIVKYMETEIEEYIDEETNEKEIITIKYYKPLLSDAGMGTTIRHNNYNNYYELLCKKYNEHNGFTLNKNEEIIPYIENQQNDFGCRYGYFEDNKMKTRYRNLDQFRRTYRRQNGTPKFYNDFSFF